MKFYAWMFGAALLLLPAQMMADGKKSHADMEAKAATIFAQADSDGNGVLSAEEFKTFHSLMRAEMEAHRFKHLDTNGDGALSLDEIKAGHHGPHGCDHHGGPSDGE